MKQNYYAEPRDVVYIRKYHFECGCCMSFRLMRELDGAIYAIYNAATLDEALKVAENGRLIPVMLN